MNKRAVCWAVVACLVGGQTRVDRVVTNEPGKGGRFGFTLPKPSAPVKENHGP